MRCVRSTDTVPEKRVRSLLHRLGFRFRLHRHDLPGKPDVVLPKYRTVVFVHGCFWHRHPNCPRATTPASRQKYWLPKFRRTVKRDRDHQEKLSESGWNVVIIWECETRDLDSLEQKLAKKIYNGLSLYQRFSIPVSKAAEHRQRYHSNKIK